jgi:hypothetical protein
VNRCRTNSEQTKSRRLLTLKCIRFRFIRFTFAPSPILIRRSRSEIRRESIDLVEAINRFSCSSSIDRGVCSWSPRLETTVKHGCAVHNLPMTISFDRCFCAASLAHFCSARPRRQGNHDSFLCVAAPHSDPLTIKCIHLFYLI